MKDINSYHIFMFPFQWTIPELTNDVFSNQIDLARIKFANTSNWQNVVMPTDRAEKEILYNEKNFFYEFTHPVLYDTGKDNNVLKHFERKETASGNVFYKIGLKGKEYKLWVDAINLNIYSTGIGVLSFYLKNKDYPEPEDVLNINQYGRRLYPPFFADIDYRNETPLYIELEGLHGSRLGYREVFDHYTPEMSNVPARFVDDMIKEVVTNVKIKPVIDDRMYVVSWYKNDHYSSLSKDEYGEFIKDAFWYKYIYVDSGNEDSLACKNDELKMDLVENATYKRWQGSGTVYAASRYSMLMLSSQECPDFLFCYFTTMYARAAELVLVQRASLLRFSAEVTNLLKKSRSVLPKNVSSLYKEYIRFINQIHFREVTAQEQGIEIYDLLYKKACIAREVEKLDKEIEELHSHASLIEDQKNNKLLYVLTIGASVFLPITVVTGVLGVDIDKVGKIVETPILIWGVVLLLLVSLSGCLILRKWINNRT